MSLSSISKNDTRVKIAEQFISQGWAPVPVPPHEKGPKITGWERRPFTSEDFTGDGNIGLKLGAASGGLVDVDLDCPEAIELAPHFLPESSMVHGRNSKPNSHYWYSIAEGLPEKITRYQDVGGATLIELRSNGGQTLVPPSIHPSGEQLSWSGTLEPKLVTGIYLARRVALVAATALIARHWPKDGSRHDCSKALAGYLARGGTSGDEVVGMIRYAAELAGDEEVADRERAAVDTVLKIERGEKVTGGPTLAGILGEQVVSKLNTWLGLRQISSTDQAEENDARGYQRGPSAADQTLSLAQESGAIFFRTPEKECFAHIPVEQHQEVVAIRSQNFRAWLRRLYFQATGRGVGTQAIEDTIATLEALTLYDGSTASVHIRMASYNGAIYIDLGDETWDVVEITASGWQIISNPPIYFRRPSGMLPLARPVHGGSLAELRPFLNLGENDEAWILAQSWLVGAYHPTGPYVHLIFSAPAGSAKSTSARLLRRLVDPNVTELRREPKDIQDVIIPAKHNRMLVFDNLSHMPTWLSDTFCTLSTGGGSSTRALYTNDEEVLFNAKGPVILTGIEELATRGDLLERSILLYPQRPAKRQTEKQVYTAFERAAPRILGGLFDAVSLALRNVKDVEIENPDRMADFEEWAYAAAPAFGVESETFLDVYRRMLDTANELVLEASPVARAVQKLMLGNPFWSGSSTELLDALNGTDPHHPDRGWPVDGPRMGNALRRVEPNLREAGIQVMYGNGGRAGRRITLQRIAQAGSSGNSKEETWNSNELFTVPHQSRQEAGREHWNGGNSKIPNNSYDGIAASPRFTTFQTAEELLRSSF